jgi:hypothetical protein
VLGNAVRIAGCLGCLAAGLAGCAAPSVPPVLAFDRADYERVFEAAIESAREDGLEPVVADRDLGVIETTPRTAGSLVEPWRTDNADVEEMVAHTVNFERRRARFEFVPEGFAVPAPDPQGPSVGPAIPGSDRAEQRFDLMKAGGRIELRAWVFVDRAFLPNQSFGRWTLGETRYSTDPTQARRPDDPATAINTQWTPIGRDEPYEQRLMQRIHALLADWRSDAADEAPTEAEPGH